MIGFLKKGVLGLALGASALAASAPAEAQRYDRYHSRGNNDAAIAVGAGVLGLAVGAAIASNNRDRYNDGYYDRRYYARPRYYSYDSGYYYGPRYRAYPRYQYRDYDRRYYDGYRGYRGPRYRDW